MEIYHAMQRFIDIRCDTQSIQELENIVSKKAQMKHATNGNIPNFAYGRSHVSELCQKHLFGKKELIGVMFKEREGKPLLELQFVEDKYENGKINKYAFHERIVFQFKEKKEKIKISLIDINVQRIALSCIQVPSLSERTD